MRWIVIAVALCVFAGPVYAAPASATALPSRAIATTPFVLDVDGLIEWSLADFDAMDAQADAARQAAFAKSPENAAKSLWAIKHQWDIGWLGFNGGILNGTILGTHLTVAEWGRWNFGTPGVGLGFIRHADYNRYTKQSVMKDDLTFLANISISYRLRQIKSLGYTAYLTFANTYDLRFSYPSSQIGFSFSRK